MTTRARGSRHPSVGACESPAKSDPSDWGGTIDRIVSERRNDGLPDGSGRDARRESVLQDIGRIKTILSKRKNAFGEYYRSYSEYYWSVSRECRSLVDEEVVQVLDTEEADPIKNCRHRFEVGDAWTFYSRRGADLSHLSSRILKIVNIKIDSGDWTPERMDHIHYTLFELLQSEHRPALAAFRRICRLYKTGLRGEELRERAKNTICHLSESIVYCDENLFLNLMRKQLAERLATRITDESLVALLSGMVANSLHSAHPRAFLRVLESLREGSSVSARRMARACVYIIRTLRLLDHLEPELSGEILKEIEEMASGEGSEGEEKDIGSSIWRDGLDLRLSLSRENDHR